MATFHSAMDGIVAAAAIAGADPALRQAESEQLLIPGRGDLNPAQPRRVGQIRGGHGTDQPLGIADAGRVQRAHPGDNFRLADVIEFNPGYFPAAPPVRTGGRRLASSFTNFAWHKARDSAVVETLS